MLQRSIIFIAIVYNVISSSRGATYFLRNRCFAPLELFVHGNKLRYKYTAPLELSQQIENVEIANIELKSQLN